MNTILLEHVTKRFGAKIALQDVTVEFSSGCIHVLLGENGAGKSTLASILGGAAVPTTGSLMMDGQPVVFSSPHDALCAGITMVHQRPLLAKELSVWENVVLGKEPVYPPAFMGIVNRKRAIREVTALQKHFDIGVCADLRQNAGELSADCAFNTAFLAALYRRPDFLVLDEPCAALDDIQREALYLRLKEAAAGGMGILVITHNVQEARRYADVVTVLRKGSLAFNGTTAEPAFNAIYPDATVPSAQDSFTLMNNSEGDGRATLLSIESLSVRPSVGAALFDISLDIESGGITLVLGQREGGIETLENVVTGMGRDKCHGKFALGEEPAVLFDEKALSMRDLRRFGTGIVPFNRTFRAANPNLTVEEVAAVYEPPQNKREVAQELICEAGITISGQEPAAHLSGGMLQRLILTRELYYKPRLLILSEPFQGLDSCASADLVARLVAVAECGTGILVLAADAATLPSVATQVYTLVAGRLQLSCKSTKEGA